jgi:hypothetical protein
MLSQSDDSFVPLSAGSRVRIRESHRAPYAGHFGIVAGVDHSDSKGPFLVRFEDGIQFRYKAAEIESAQEHQHRRNHSLGKIMKTHFQLLFLSILVSGMLLSACGPEPNPKLQGKAAESQEPAPAPAAAPAPAPAPQPQPAAAPVVEAPRPQPVKPKQQTTAKPAPRVVNAPAPSPAPVSSTASSAPGTLTLPAPVAPPVPVPAPPVDEVKPERVEPPAPRQITVPSGTLVAVRMIDSVDSETARVG